MSILAGTEENGSILMLGKPITSSISLPHLQAVLGPLSVVGGRQGASAGSRGGHGVCQHQRRNNDLEPSTQMSWHWLQFITGCLCRDEESCMSVEGLAHSCLNARWRWWRRRTSGGERSWEDGGCAVLGRLRG